MTKHLWRRRLKQLTKKAPGRREGALRDRRAKLLLEHLEERWVPSTLIISEVNPSGSGSSYGADWFDWTDVAGGNTVKTARIVEGKWSAAPDSPTLGNWEISLEIETFGF